MGGAKWFGPRCGGGWGMKGWSGLAFVAFPAERGGLAAVDPLFLLIHRDRTRGRRFMVHGHFTVSEQRLSGFHDRSLSGIVVSHPDPVSARRRGGAHRFALRVLRDGCWARLAASASPRSSVLRGEGRCTACGHANPVHAAGCPRSQGRAARTSVRNRSASSRRT